MSLKIVSTFGDHTSLYPLAVKDCVNSLGMTAFSYDAGGKIEAKDRFIDEFGTQAIWLGGLPFFKWAFNKTAYKAANLNPNIDVRLVADKEQLEVASKYAKKYAKKLNDPNIVNSLTDASKQSKLFRNLFLSKFATATALTLGSFFTLVKVKQEYTKKQIEKEFWEKKAKEGFYKNDLAKSQAFKGFAQNATEKSAQSNGNKKSPSFKGISGFMQSFMLDPVKNLFIVDAGITSERLASSRTKSEFFESAIKEGSLLIFMYVAGRYVQKGIEKFSEKVFKKPIELHAEFLASDELKNSIKSGKINKDLDEFSKISGNNKAIYEFFYSEKNADNIIVQAAKKSGIIDTIKEQPKSESGFFKSLFTKKKDTGLVNPHQYIDAENMKELANNLSKVKESFKNSGESIEQFLKKSTNLKIGSVAANIGISCLFLGLIVPYTMLKYREKQNGNKEFHVQKQIQQNLENNFKARQNTIAKA